MLHESGKEQLELASAPALVFKHVGVAVNGQGTFLCKGKSSGGEASKKQILQGITGSALGGRMLAIMGGSGAGKTTLLDVLTLKKTSGVSVEGSVTLNGQPLTENLLLKSAAHVAQDALLWWTLTTRETLEHCAELYGQELSKAQRAELVEAVINQTGLKSCEHTRVGNAFVKGLSGGQRKRLCIAEALLKQPAMLVLDEPTSSLDSSSAVEVVQLLRRLAKASNILVICTIHQPSQRIFGLFDDVLVLARGQIAYAGPVKDVGRHMQSLDVPPMEDGSSLPEYLLDLTNSDFTDEQQVQKILDNWSASEQAIVSAETAAPMREAKMRGLVAQTLILCRRLAIMTVRDPTVYSARWVFAATANLVFSLIYIDARDRNQEQALPRIWVMSWCLGAPVFMSIVVIPVYYQDFLVYKKEIGNGMYKPAAYVLSQTVVMIPSILAFSLFALLPPFLIVGYKWESFLQMLICHAVAMLWAECTAQLLAVCFPHFLLAMAAYINVAFVAFLQSGMVISIDSIDWALRWVAYINPWMYTLRAMIYFDFADSSFSGFGDRGEQCAPPPAACFGSQGDAVLDGIGTLLSSYSSSIKPWQDVGISAAVALVLKLLQYIALRTFR
ncbi:unnamed protein product [Polarella glacialis]|uniref:ABC transporter domain-containing protein n=1 Tax=Polarella glacialis TaxID=89957 RepID=A0A813D8U4_POLGL|nr:unnamed protein product [Polarella glacialis]